MIPAPPPKRLTEKERQERQKQHMEEHLREQNEKRMELFEALREKDRIAAEKAANHTKHVRHATKDHDMKEEEVREECVRKAAEKLSDREGKLNKAKKRALAIQQRKEEHMHAIAENSARKNHEALEKARLKRIQDEHEREQRRLEAHQAAMDRQASRFFTQMS